MANQTLKRIGHKAGLPLSFPLAEYMSIRTIHILLLAILLVGGCSDTVTNHYPTRAKAEADKLKRGTLCPGLKKT